MAHSLIDKPLIVFDIGNVLLRFSKERAGKNFDRIEPGAGPVLVRALWETRLGLDLEKGQVTGPEFFRRAARTAGVGMGYEAFCAAFRDIFTPIPENLRLLVRLSKTHPTALLSNTSGIHWRYLLRTYPALQAARWPLASHLLKCMKPNPLIFKLLSKKTGFDFKDMVYVDDRPEFVRVAKRLGINALCFTGRTPLKTLFTKAGVR